MQPQADDALDKVVCHKDLEHDATSSEDARDRGGLEPPDDAGIPRAGGGNTGVAPEEQTVNDGSAQERP